PDALLLEHDLFRKPVPTFRDHALRPPLYYAIFNAIFGPCRRAGAAGCNAIQNVYRGGENGGSPSGRLVVSGAPSIRAVALAAGRGRAAGILDLGKSAQAEPVLELLAQRARAVELDLARADGGFQRKIAHEDPGHRAQVAHDIQANLEPRIIRA